jgi:hypothetical protein
MFALDLARLDYTKKNTAHVRHSDIRAEEVYWRHDSKRKEGQISSADINYYIDL